MSPISSLRHSTHDYAAAATLGVHIIDNHSLFQGDKIFEENLLEHLYDEIYILRGRNGEPVAHWPVS